MKCLTKSIILSGLFAIANADPSIYKTSYQVKDLENWLFKNRICSSTLSEAQCMTNQNNLKNNLGFEYEQIGTKNPLSISNISAYSIKYLTKGINDETRTVSGGVLIPDAPVGKIKGILLFYHSTEMTKYNVPSCFFKAENLPTYCNINKNVIGSNYVMELGSIFASQGYIVVMPDYIGQGIDSDTMHPYVAFPENSANVGLDMLTPTKELLKSLNIENDKLNLYISGYS